MPLARKLCSLPAANSIAGNSYSWNLADLALFGSKQIVLQLLIPADAPDGNTRVGTALAVLGNGTDFNPADNSLDIYSKVEDSYDPNDKAVVPEGNLTPQQIAAGQRLSYTVRFQNTGTASALAVTVIDTLDPQIDWRTFRVIASSHPVKWQMKGSGIVEFSLTDLQLPPATVDETASHGYLQFEVDANTDLVIGDIIRNSAHIYFDYNAPVITNTVSNTVSQVNNTYAANLNSQIVIYPTLVPDALTVENGSLTDLHFEILTTQGQTTGVSGLITRGSNRIRLGHLQKGAYILLLMGKDGRTEKSFFKI